MRKVVLASRNEDKVRELKQMVEGLGFEVASAADYPGLPEIIEDGTTIDGNARRKALLTAAYTGEIAVADDTSLEVRVLNNMPDIFAARFSGPDATYSSNARLVLELMQDVGDEKRQARFATAAVWVDPNPGEGERQVLSPATSRRLRNPWGPSRRYPDRAGEWAYWNGLADRTKVWAAYRRRMESDLADWGQDQERLLEISTGLFRGCPDALREGEELVGGYGEGGMRLPDPDIWALAHGDDAGGAKLEYAPSCLPADAPGLSACGPVWLEITAVGKILGHITRQPMGGGGFGYDPIFRPEGEQGTLAELPAEVKNAISHRGVAMRRMMLAVKRAYAGEQGE
jgi:non-canonical purine NTP pyrophosphatase (RdgB/HAM1 family)